MRVASRVLVPVLATLLLGCPADEPEAEVIPDVAIAADVAEAEDTAQPDTSDEPDVQEQPDTKPPVEDIPETPDIPVVPDEGPPPECITGDDCKDFDNCTEDVCTAEGKCANPPKIGCCVSDAECDDGINCTDDTCNTTKQECQYTFESNLCCLTGSDCNDADACTIDLCANNLCVHPQNPVNQCACVNSALCDDGNPCTTEECLGGVCQYASTADVAPDDGLQCCASAGDCDDGDAATFDSCQQAICWHGAAPCAVAEDCASPSACIKASCLDNACVFAEPPGCCITDAECADGLASTEDSCVNSQCVNTLGSPTQCSSDTDCFQPNGCSKATCKMEAGLCSFEALPGASCCTSKDECPKPDDDCVEAVCSIFECLTQDVTTNLTYWESTWDDGSLGGWTVEQDQTSARWQVSDGQAISKPNALYYGRLPQKDYDVGTTLGSVTSAMITPQAGPVLVFFERNAAIEPISSRDLLWLELVINGAPVSVWDKGFNNGPGLGWKTVELDITQYATGPFQLRFRFDSIDGVNNDTEGVYIDNVRIQTPCQ